MRGEPRNDGICPICQVRAVKNGKPLKSTKDALTYLKHFRTKNQEYVISLSLDSIGRVISRRIVTIGLLNSSLVHPREIYAGPLADRAASIIVAHNHPSNDPMPSKADIKTTQQLAAAGILLGIPLDDHIIITTKKYF